MDKRFQDIIYSKIDNLSPENQKLICNVIAEAMEPLMHLKKSKDLEGVYYEYLRVIWNDLSSESNLYTNYNQEIECFFEFNEYDEDSYDSYDDSNFFEYLSYMAILVLRNALYNNGTSFIRFSLNSIVKVSEVLDDYLYFKNKENLEVGSFEELLQVISHRNIQNLCEDLLKSSVEICLNYRIEDKIDILKSNLMHYRDNLSDIMNK